MVGFAPRALLLTALTLAQLLAGCSGGSAEATDDERLADLEEQAADDVDVEATKTTGVIRGIVVDEAIRPIGAATVRLRTTPPQEATTTEAGAFGFDDLEPGTYFLDVQKEGFARVQTSVDVVAAVDEPEIVKVLMTAVFTGIPSFETLRLVMHLSGSGWVQAPPPVGGSGVTCCFVDGINRSWFFNMDFGSNGTRFVQTITTWEPNAAVSDTARVYVQLSSGEATLADNVTISASPAIHEFRGVFADMTDPVHIYGNIYAYPTDPVPVGLSVEQDYTIYAIAFNNFDPPANYRFDLDGEPSLPPA